MSLRLSNEDLKRIFDISSQDGKTNNNIHVKDKLAYVKSHLSNLLILSWVKYIAITGSVAAGNVKENDDIDLFIVVKNDRIWFYRGLILLKNFKSGVLRKENEKHINNKLCHNIIREERNLKFESDMFNFHELMYLMPIYNKQYTEKVYSENLWIKKYGHSEVRNIDSSNERNYIFAFIDFFAMLTMVIYMTILKHNPNYSRIWKNFKKGKIEFYPEHFKEEKLKQYHSNQ